MNRLDSRCPKFAEYVDFIQEHVIGYLRRSAATESTFAALMLIFACCDGLGRLLHKEVGRKALANECFKGFIGKLGADYEAKKNLLWELRNQLDHNALSVGAFISRAPEAGLHHLDQCPTTKTIVVHAGTLLADFERALDELIDDLLANAALANQFDSRLEHRSIAATYSNLPGTQAPTVGFVAFK